MSAACETVSPPRLASGTGPPRYPPSTLPRAFAAARAAFVRLANIKRRLDALRQARVDSQIEGQRAHPDDAKLLDALTRGEIDGDEARGRTLARISAEAKRQKTVA